MNVREFREITKKEINGNGILYLIFVTLICLFGIGTGLYFLLPFQINLVHIIFIIGSIIFSNFVEYFLHRFPMHHLTFLKGIYKMHSGVHHRYFTSEFMNIESKDDIFHVSTSIKVISLFVCSIIIPISLIVWLIANIKFGLLFFIVALSYYLIYELTHLYCHLPSDSWYSNIPYLRNCRRRHRRHHNPKVMRSRDFNVSFPLFDYIFRTRTK